MDSSPPGSSVLWILQARILEWAAMLFSRGSSQPSDGTRVSCSAGGFFTEWATRKDPFNSLRPFKKYRWPSPRRSHASSTLLWDCHLRCFPLGQECRIQESTGHLGSQMRGLWAFSFTNKLCSKRVGYVWAEMISFRHFYILNIFLIQHASSTTAHILTWLEEKALCAKHAEAQCCCCLVAKSCPTLVTPWTVACHSPLSMWLSQARILEMVAISFSRGPSWAKDRT